MRVRKRSLLSRSCRFLSNTPSVSTAATKKNRIFQPFNFHIIIYCSFLSISLIRASYRNELFKEHPSLICEGRNLPAAFLAAYKFASSCALPMFFLQRILLLPNQLETYKYDEQLYQGCLAIVLFKKCLKLIGYRIQ